MNTGPGFFYINGD